MSIIGHYINGKAVAGNGSEKEIYNPAMGKVIKLAKLATVADVDAAVAAAKSAFPSWSQTGLQSRATLMLDLRDAIKGAKDELVELVIAELGKTRVDAEAEVDRGIEILAQAASVGNWYGSTLSPGVSRGVDAYEVRYPIGVVAGISPFNFPVMIPILQAAMSIVCGNTFVMKPSERNPSSCYRIAELFKTAGLPDGVFNVVMGDRIAVDRLLEHPDVAGITFVGSTPVASHVRKVGVANNKRVQAFGGGKNHMIVLPDSDLDMAADAAVSAAYGAAGQRCMAVSVVVAVGDIGDQLVAKIAERLPAIKTGSPTDAGSDMGPVITAASHQKIKRYIESAQLEGATVVVDGRDTCTDEEGWFVAPTLIDHVKEGMKVHAEEIFGPVLSVVRVSTYEEAAKLIDNHQLGNGAAIFTRDGGVAKRFVGDVRAGQVGVNIPIPFPTFFHSFGGWKDSSFTETKLFGPGALNFCTQSKTVSVRWPDPSTSKVNLGFPTE